MKPHGIGRVSTLALLVSLVLAGCGSDGNDAQPNIETAQSVEQLNLSVIDIEQINGVTEITVLATNEDEHPVIGLSELEIRQYQLYPIGYNNSGDSAYWQSNGSFSEHRSNNDGTYTFALTDAEQDRSLTQRYNVIASASTLSDGTVVPHKEISVDFSGDGGPARYSKNVVSQQTCEQCHSPAQPLSQRHGSFYELETCISCHNEDPEGRFAGELASFQHLIHAVHSTHGHGEPAESQHAFTDRYGNSYDGTAGAALIKDNCQVCHQANDELTEWGNWSRVPTKETCAGCHNEGYDSETKAIIHTSHLAGFSDNTSCSSCHGADQIERIHDTSTEQANTDAVINLLSTEMGAEAQANGDVVATITLYDAAGNAVNANEYKQHINWVEVIANVNPQAGQLSYFGKKTANYKAGDEANNTVTFTENGTVQATFSGLLTGAFAAETAHVIAGIRYFAKDGELATAADDAELITGKGAAAVAAISGAPVERHDDSVDATGCASCHGDHLQIHNGLYSAGFLLNDALKIGDCAACHNPQGIDFAPNVNGALETIIHITHGKPSFGSNCAACHTSFNLDSFADKGPIHWYADGIDYFASPFAATCSSCHNNDAARNHMVISGDAVFNTDKTMVDGTVESCLDCHQQDDIIRYHSVQF